MLTRKHVTACHVRFIAIIRRINNSNMSANDVERVLMEEYKTLSEWMKGLFRDVIYDELWACDLKQIDCRKRGDLDHVLTERPLSRWPSHFYESGKIKFPISKIRC